MKNIQLLSALAAILSDNLQPTKGLSFGYEKLIVDSQYTSKPVKKKTILKAKGKKK